MGSSFLELIGFIFGVIADCLLLVDWWSIYFDGILEISMRVDWLVVFSPVDRLVVFLRQWLVSACSSIGWLVNVFGLL